jgi:hypothetical protein
MVSGSQFKELTPKLRARTASSSKDRSEYSAILCILDCKQARFPLPRHAQLKPHSGPFAYTFRREFVTLDEKS